ncbi:MAG: MFS transporter, partial [Paracoccaceae bacterium]|nr:MFS transporter [Paracoccaceae bacterium]
MFRLFGGIWALLLGMFLLMVGNGLQSTLIGVRASIEGFSTLELSIVTSAYFLGFLGGSIMAPGIINRVG